MDVRETFGRNLRRLRLAKGLTQEALEGISGFDRVYISGMERGKRNPSITALDILAKALGAKIPEFFDSVDGS